MSRRACLIVPLLAACATGAPAGLSGDDAAGVDADVDAALDGLADAAPPVSPDAAPPAAAPAPLLLTEIVLAPAGAEMIEIANPTDETVALADYYLADVGDYFRLPAGDLAVASSDFVARFPADAMLAPGEVAIVALDTAAAFTTATTVAPDWSIAGGTMSMVSGSAATLTNAGEIVVLFHWDRAADVVTDVDLMIAGAATASNGLVAKSSVTIDGPDADTLSTAYAADANTIHGQAAAAGSGLSTKRVLLPAGHEAAGGNGVGGLDATSEDTAATWDASYSAPTPGVTPLAL